MRSSRRLARTPAVQYVEGVPPQSHELIYVDRRPCSMQARVQHGSHSWNYQKKTLKHLSLSAGTFGFWSADGHSDTVSAKVPFTSLRLLCHGF